MQARDRHGLLVRLRAIKAEIRLRAATGTCPQTVAQLRGQRVVLTLEACYLTAVRRNIESPRRPQSLRDEATLRVVAGLLHFDPS